MAYTYNPGDPVSVLDPAEPNGATEPVSNLDNAIRQIKAYLNDPTVGPAALFALKLAATKVVATQVSSQVIAAGAGITPVEFDNEDLDPSNEFDPVTFKFTADADGFYLVMGQVTVDVTASAAPTDIKYQLDVFVDGTSGARTVRNMGTNENTQDLPFNRGFDLSAGQTIWVKLTVTVGSGTLSVTILNDPRETIFQVVKLPIL